MDPKALGSQNCVCERQFSGTSDRVRVPTDISPTIFHQGREMMFFLSREIVKKKKFIYIYKYSSHQPTNFFWG